LPKANLKPTKLQDEKMKTLLFVTGNRHKFQQIAEVLAEYGIALKQHSTELEEIDSSDQKKIALHKAKQAFALLRQPLIVEDTGIWFKAFKNFPGTKPKRVFEQLGFEGLLKKLEGKNRQAFFLCTICFIESEKKFHFFEGKLEGAISKKVIAPEADAMPYAKIFIPKGHEIALSEMTLQEKNAISHRGIAAKKLAEWINSKSG
jgi:XTP/dITP diphosphohydrolase